jgi:N6-L-threonylcarbamoyladenine synthase
VASQADDFASWGGVVPEIAARGHVLALPGLVERVLAQAGVGVAELDAVAVGAWPGLIGSLLLRRDRREAHRGALRLPLIAVDHIQAHLAAMHLGGHAVCYPLVGLVASGGHSHTTAPAPGRLELLGGTIDDAAGEAFDKAAAMLELAYPGGPQIDRMAEHGSPPPSSCRAASSMMIPCA